MSQVEATTESRRPRWAAVVAWLRGASAGRWASVCPGRWIRTALTTALALAGIAAWAIALVQPWTGKAGVPGIITLPKEVDAGRVKSVAVDLSRLAAPAVVPLVPPERNPFALTAAADAQAAAPAATAVGAACKASAATAVHQPKSVAAAAPAPAPPAGSAADSKDILESLKHLKLQVILITPAGERWAVINGNNYREGDAIAGLVITEIQEGRVKLQRDGATCLLRMD